MINIMLGGRPKSWCMAFLPRQARASIDAVDTRISGYSCVPMVGRG
jgi:hypothetical protein